MSVVCVLLVATYSTQFYDCWFCDNFISFLDRILKNNQLTGPIPSTLSQIPNLKTL
jgi:hypothetical protein